MSPSNRKRRSESDTPLDAKRFKADPFSNIQQPSQNKRNKTVFTRAAKSEKNEEVHFTNIAVDVQNTFLPAMRTDFKSSPTSKISQPASIDSPAEHHSVTTAVVVQKVTADRSSTDHVSNDQDTADKDCSRERVKTDASSATTTKQQPSADACNKNRSMSATTAVQQRHRDTGTKAQSTSMSTPQQSSSDVRAMDDFNRKRKAEASDEPQGKRNKTETIAAAAPGAIVSSLKAGDGHKERPKIQRKMYHVLNMQMGINHNKNSAELDLKRKNRAGERKKKEQERKLEEERRVEERKKEEQQRKAEEQKRKDEEKKQKEEEEDKQKKEKEMAMKREAMKQKIAAKTALLQATLDLKIEEDRKKKVEIKLKRAEERKKQEAELKRKLLREINYVPYSAESVPILYSTKIDHNTSNELPYTPAWGAYVHGLEIIKRGFCRNGPGLTSTPLNLGRAELPDNARRCGPARVIDDVDLFIHQRDIHVRDDPEDPRHIDCQKSIYDMKTVYVSYCDHGLVSVDQYLHLIGVPDTQPVRFNGRVPNWAKAIIKNAEKRRVIKNFRPSDVADPNELELVAGRHVEIYDVQMHPYSEYTDILRPWALAKQSDSDRVGWFPYHDGRHVDEYTVPLSLEELDELNDLEALSWAKPCEGMVWEEKRGKPEEKSAAELLLEEAQKYEEMDLAAAQQPSAVETAAKSSSGEDTSDASSKIDVSLKTIAFPPGTPVQSHDLPVAKAREARKSIEEDEVDWDNSDDDERNARR